jgi:hypothetical protein
MAYITTDLILHPQFNISIPSASTSVFIPHGWHARARTLPSFPPPYFQPNLALAIVEHGLAGTGIVLGLFYPNLALDAQGATLALEQRDWNALLGLGQRAGCLDPWLTAASGGIIDSKHGSGWSAKTDATCQNSHSIIVPHDIPKSPRENLERQARPRVATLDWSWGSIWFHAWGPRRRRLDSGGLLPLSLHELMVVLTETYDLELDNLPPIITTWLNVCRKIAIDLDRHPSTLCNRVYWRSRNDAPINTCGTRFEEEGG